MPDEVSGKKQILKKMYQFVLRMCRVKKSLNRKKSNQTSKHYSKLKQKDRIEFPSSLDFLS